MTDSVASQNIRVLLVDDSAVIRHAISSFLKEEEGIEIVGKAVNGQMGVEMVASLKPDVVILDVEMPIMNGMEALPHIMKAKPDVKVLVCSTLSERGAEISIKAMEMGAADCLLKPSSMQGLTAVPDFRDRLVQLVRLLGKRRTRPTLAGSTVTPKPSAPSAPINIVKTMVQKPGILAIGCSTGGPQALMKVLPGLKNLRVPIVITQHMPRTFTAVLARQISSSCNLPAHEAEEGMVLTAGHAYVAQGGFHMVLKKKDDGKIYIHLDDGPQENFCKPSVDPMMRSLLPIFGPKILAVILTGMGSDGLISCKELSAQGATVIAQNEETSVVWGMPGAVARAGICSAVLPLNEVDSYIREKVGVI